MLGVCLVCFQEMRVRVLYFGVLKEIAGCEHEWLEIADGADVAGLLARCRETRPSPAGLWRSLAVAVNLRYAPAAQLLHEDDEVALLPPVSGGSCAQD